MTRSLPRQLRPWILALGISLGTSQPLHAQSVLYLTDGDASTLQAVDTATGSLVYSVTSSQLAYPIAVRNLVVLGHRDHDGLTGQYSLTNGAPVGNVVPNPAGTANFSWSQALDGAASATNNYTFAWGSGTMTIYQTDLDWTNPVPLFTLASTYNDVMGITYDTVRNTLWMSGSTSIYQFGLDGTLLSSFTQSGTGYRGALAYQASTDSLWLVPNYPTAPLLQYSPTGTLLQSLTVNGRSGNIWGAEFTAVPEPATWLLLGLGALGLLVFRHRAS